MGVFGSAPMFCGFLCIAETDRKLQCVTRRSCLFSYWHPGQYHFYFHSSSLNHCKIFSCLLYHFSDHIIINRNVVHSFMLSTSCHYDSYGPCLMSLPDNSTEDCFIPLQCLSPSEHHDLGLTQSQHLHLPVQLDKSTILPPWCTRARAVPESKVRTTLLNHQ